MKTVMAAVNPILAGLTSTLQELVGAVATLKEAASTPKPEVAPVAPPPTPGETEIAKSADVAKQLSELQKRLETVVKSVASATPAVPARQEGLDTTAPPKKPDPNSVFDGLFFGNK